MANEQNLKPFTGADDPRRSNGRPKGVPNAKTRYQRILNLIERIKNPVTGETEEFTVAEVLDLKLIEKARKGDIRAYQEVMDRLEGKAQQSIDMNVDGKVSIVTVKWAGEDEPDSSAERDNNTPRIS